MALYLVTAPTVEPVSVAEAKAHLRIDTADEDDAIRGLIVAAREYVENFTSRALLQQTWDLKLDGFPCGDIWLPKPPVSSVTSISYVDTNGDTQTWDSSNYTTDLPTGPHARAGRIALAYSKTYPTTRDVINAVTVRLVCGYGSARSSVPEMLRVCSLEHVRANYSRGTKDEEPEKVMAWVDRQLWAFKAF